MPEHDLSHAGQLAQASQGPSMSPETLLARARIGMTREEIVEVLGEPDDVGYVSRKRRTPNIYVYRGVELHFEPSKTGRLSMIYAEDDDGNVQLLLKE